ncbi:metallophosphoesterase family protein [Jannaschia pohangensis]|uniref:Serine/threonine protein phosphatase 1 n=1 Tax=Jannaschia pohangensis TaxID=390807 RepID=A0A1I3NS59_9RHOB|nr:metallophosphoesterase family protein [Jannaschia pohangensis]SFJ12104.1 serine/threonine protein phosphatase 1 [Jannaschia pohangensis]
MPYAIGDLHGYADQFDRTLALVEADGGADAPIVFLGDYVDRGPDARGVLDRLIAGVDQGRNWTVLLGNHDRMFLRFLRSGDIHDPAIKSGKSWLHPALGGPTTLASYGVSTPHTADMANERGDAARKELRAAALEAVPETHLSFLENLPRIHITDAQVFVHAGIRPGLPLGMQVEDDLIWIREPFLTDRRDHLRLVVHGHTPVDTPTHYGNRLNLDTGAGYGHPATAALVDGTRAWAVTGAGRVPISS